MLYFAYGSNCSQDRMNKRKVAHALRCQGIIRDYKLVFNKKSSSVRYTSTTDSYFPKVFLATAKDLHSNLGSGYVSKSIKKRDIFREASEGYANIIPSKGDIVYGALYVLEADGIKELDKAEGVPTNHYTREVMKVETEFGFEVDSIIYIAHPDKIANNLMPSEEYLEHILKGKDLMPVDYYNKLASSKTLPKNATTTTTYNRNTANNYSSRNGYNDDYGYDGYGTPYSGRYNNNTSTASARNTAQANRNTKVGELVKMTPDGKRQRWEESPTEGWGWKNLT